MSVKNFIMVITGLLALVGCGKSSGNSGNTGNTGNNNPPVNTIKINPVTTTATCDFEMDTADKDKQIEMPAIVLWGARGQSLARSKEFLDVWKKFAKNLEYGEAMDCGHYMTEDIPDIIYDKFTKFFVA